MAIDMTPGGGAPTLTLTSGIAETGKGLYGTGDTGALISTGSKAAVESPPPAKIEDSAATYAPEQPTEQRPPEPKKNSPKTSSTPQETPADVTKENVPPPQELIDVVKDYDWTLSINKAQMIDKIPIIRLKEFKITADNAINALAAGVFAWGDMQKAGANALGKMGSLAGAGLTDAASMMGLDSQLQFLKDQKDSKFGKVVASAGGAIGDTIDSFVATAKELASRAQPPSDFGPEGQHLMDVYGGLYAREATGRTYTLPYFANDYFNTSNTFSDTTTMPLVGAVYEKLSEVANLLPALVEPGVYVQRPQYYNFDTSGNEFSLSITLYNTITPLEHLKNSKLIQQLILNNLPRRKTRVVVEPPCIYEVLIPGKAFFPYCYISDLRVLHIGTKRLMNGEIVPDAFEVQITIKSLTSDANNFYEKQMQHHEMTFPTAADVTPWGDASAAPSTAGAAGAAGGSAGASGQQRDSIATPAGATGGSIPVGSSGKVSPADLQAYTEERIKNSKLNGYVPADAAKYGIDGSPKSWANFFNKLAAAESGYNVNSTNTADPGGSYGLFQVAPADGKRYGANPTGQNWTTQQLRDPKINTDTAIAIFERNTMKSGRIESSGGKGAGGYFAAASMRKVAKR